MPSRIADVRLPLSIFMTIIRRGNGAACHPFESSSSVVFANRLDPIIELDPPYLQRDGREGTLAKMTPPQIADCRLPFHLHWRDSAWHRETN